MTYRQSTKFIRKVDHIFFLKRSHLYYFQLSKDLAFIFCSKFTNIHFTIFYRVILLGRAEALGTLCRVLCSKQCREEVLAPYLARCYAAIHRGLRDPATAAAVVLNAADIFR